MSLLPHTFDTNLAGCPQNHTQDQSLAKRTQKAVNSALQITTAKRVQVKIIKKMCRVNLGESRYKPLGVLSRQSHTNMLNSASNNVWYTCQVLPTRAAHQTLISRFVLEGWRIVFLSHKHAAPMTDLRGSDSKPPQQKWATSYKILLA